MEGRQPISKKVKMKDIDVRSVLLFYFVCFFGYVCVLVKKMGGRGVVRVGCQNWNIIFGGWF